MYATLSLDDSMCAVFHEKNYLLFLMTFDYMSLDLFIHPIFYHRIKININSVQIRFLRSYEKNT